MSFWIDPYLVKFTSGTQQDGECELVSFESLYPQLDWLNEVGWFHTALKELSPLLSNSDRKICDKLASFALVARLENSQERQTELGPLFISGVEEVALFAKELATFSPNTLRNAFTRQHPQRTSRDEAIWLDPNTASLEEFAVYPYLPGIEHEQKIGRGDDFENLWYRVAQWHLLVRTAAGQGAGVTFTVM